MAEDGVRDQHCFLCLLSRRSCSCPLDELATCTYDCRLISGSGTNGADGVIVYPGARLKT